MRVMVVSPDRNKPLVEVIESHLQSNGAEAVEVATPERAEALSLKTTWDLILVTLDGEQPEFALSAVRRLREAHGGRLMVAGPATDAKLILRAMQAGADLFLDERELAADLDAALATMRSRRAPAARPGQLIAVLSAAGGCGASTVAVNLAALLAKQYGRCNLIDLNAGKADLAPLLDLKPQYTFADLCRNDVRLDRSMYEKLLTPHKSGVGLLAAPREFEEVYSITPQGVSRAVTLAQESFTDVVVDLEDCFHDEQVAVLEQATRVLLVCRLDFTAVRNTRRVLDYLAARGLPLERVEVVVNHHGMPSQLPLEEAEEAIGRKLTTFVPHDPATAGAASNMGTPMAWSSPTAPVVQSIARIVGLDTPAPPGPAKWVRIARWFHAAVVRRARDLALRVAQVIPTSRSAAPSEEIVIRHAPVNAPTAGAIDARPISA